MMEIKEYKYIEYIPVKNDENNKYFIPLQILSHLNNCKKVLYTNGLEFYFLTTLETENEENQRIVKIQKVGDLSQCYENYKNGDRSLAFVENANKEWDELINNLVEINWHSEPKQPIPPIPQKQHNKK